MLNLKSYCQARSFKLLKVGDKKIRPTNNNKIFLSILSNFILKFDKKNKVTTSRDEDV